MTVSKGHLSAFVITNSPVVLIKHVKPKLMQIILTKACVVDMLLSVVCTLVLWVANLRPAHWNCAHNIVSVTIMELINCSYLIEIIVS